MQLLSQTQVKNRTREAENSEKRTLADLASRIFDRTRELNTLNADIERNQKADQERQKERNDRIVALNDEIASLETARKRLLVPIDAIKKNLETQIAENSKTKHVLTQEKIHIAEQRQNIFEKTEELIELEQSLNERKESLTEEQRGIEKQREELKRINNELQERLKIHSQQISDINIAFQSQQNELAQKEHALHIKELTFAQQQEEWENIKNTEQRQLADQRETLERALNRIKK